jgi:FAD/FMN-containing dehydrogenase
MRGNGHSPFGQAQAAAGIVIDSSSLSTIHHIEVASAVPLAGRAFWGPLAVPLQGQAAF